MKLHFKINLTEGQKEAYNIITTPNNYRFITLCWSRQSGKSALMKVLCIKWLFEYQKEIGYVCRNYILAKKLYGDVIKAIPKQYIVSANGSDLTIQTVFKSKLQFFSAESGSSLRGLTFNYLVCDEFAFFKQEQTDGTHLWNDILFPTIKVKGKRILFVSTPLGKNNIFYDMYLKGLDKSFYSYYTIKKTIYDDGLIDEQGIEEIKSQIPELSFKQEFLCEFLDSASTFFSGFEKCFSSYIYDETKPQFIGIDLSATEDGDDTILTKINSLNQTKQYTITGTLKQKYKKIAEIINETPNLKCVYIEKNGIGAPMIDNIKDLVKNKSIIKEWLTTNKSKEEILGNLSIEISKNDIYFDINDKYLYSQFGSFVCSYSKSGNLLLGARAGYHDDKILSMGIALKCKKDNTIVGNYSFGLLSKR